MNFPYLYVQESLDSIDIEDIGNVALQLNNDLGECWYLLISTKLGWTSIQQFGPMSLVDNFLLYNFMYTYNKFEFNDTKIIKRIDKFINDPKKLVTQIFFVNPDEILEKLKNLNERS